MISSPVAPRTPEFSHGVNPSPAESPGLMASSMNFNSKKSTGFQISSILDAGQSRPSMSGYSKTDYQRVTPAGELPSPNGISSKDYAVMNTTQFPTHLNV